jgi:polysaccharide pyruvyl transferase WcaK-like protein
MKNVKRVGLLGPYGYGNLGDAAIQQAMIVNIRKRFNQVEIIGICALNREAAQERYQIDVFPISRSSVHRKVRKIYVNEVKINKVKKVFFYAVSPVTRLLRALIGRTQEIVQEINHIVESIKFIKTLDSVFVSGGGQLDDYWGGSWGHPYALLKWALLTKIVRKKFYVVSVGAEPIRSKLSIFFIKRALLLSQYRSLRDNKSKCFIEGFGIKKNNRVFPDLAFSLPVARWKNSFDASCKLTVAICPISSSAWQQKDDNAYHIYLNELVNLSTWLIENNFRISLFPSQLTMDPPVIEKVILSIKNRISAKRERQIVYKEVNNLKDLLIEINASDIVFASRLHGIILSLVMHKPVLAISYLPKVSTLMDEIKLSENCIEYDQFNLKWAIDRIISVKNNKETLTSKIRSTTNQYHDSLMEQYELIFRSMDNE